MTSPSRVPARVLPRTLAASSLSAALLLALVGAAPQRAEACGGMIFSEHAERQGGMNGQELFLSLGPDATTLVVSASFIDVEGDKAFLLPLRVVPEEVRDGDQALFVALETGTVPVITINQEIESSPGCSFGAKSGGDRGNEAGNADVEVLARGATATYEYVVVGGDTGTALVDWLDGNGFAAPSEYAAALDGYAGEGWYFLAAKLASTAPEGELAPLELGFAAAPGSATTIPFAIASYALAPEASLDLTLYVASVDAAVLPQNQAVATIDEDALEALDESSSNYAALFDELVAAAPTWVVESSDGQWSPSTLVSWAEGSWRYDINIGAIDAEGTAWLEDFSGRLGYGEARLTRLRTRQRAGDLVDLQLGPAQAIEVDRAHQVSWDPDGEAGCRVADPLGGTALLGLGLLGLLGLRRRSAGR